MENNPEELGSTALPSKLHSSENIEVSLECIDDVTIKSWVWDTKSPEFEVHLQMKDGKNVFVRAFEEEKDAMIFAGMIESIIYDKKKGADQTFRFGKNLILPSRRDERG